MKKLIARVLLFFLLFNLIPLNNVNNTFADDSDGTANLNLTLSSNIVESSII
jgi:hypothetical protein